MDKRRSISITERIARQHAKYEQRRERRRSHIETPVTIEHESPSTMIGYEFFEDAIAMEASVLEADLDEDTDRALGEAWLDRYWGELPDYYQEQILNAAVYSRRGPLPPLWLVLRDNGWGPWGKEIVSEEVRRERLRCAEARERSEAAITEAIRVHEEIHAYEADRALGEAWLAEHWDDLPDLYKERILFKAAFSRHNPAPPLWVILRDNGWGPWERRPS